MGYIIISIALFILVLITISLGVRIVPQGQEWVVERLGKYHSTLNPGLSLLIPYIDRVAYKVPTKDIILDVPQQEVISKDNAVLHANAIAFIKITDTSNAVYGVEDYSEAVTNLVQTTLRSIIGSMSLDDALSSREVIKAKLKDSIADDVAEWGLTLKSVEIQDIRPSPTMQQSMELQAAAERERKAAVIRAEGDKSAAILEAEGRLAAAKLDADAQIKLAESASTAIKSISDAIGKDPAGATFLLGEKYVQALREMGTSSSGKTIMLPSDLMLSIRNIMGLAK